MIEKEPKKKTYVTLWVFYFLIVFEILYMITPFGIYYYSVYGKGLNFLNSNVFTSWLSDFFLPHIVVSTQSPVLNLYLDYLREIGWLFALLGFIVFIISAGQIYYGKFRKKDAITGGIYRYIRHPQYSALIICGFGLLLVWPRMIVLIMFIIMLTVYYSLAKSEEIECTDKFGKTYSDYINKTGMFLPFFIENLFHKPKSVVKSQKIRSVLSTLMIIAIAMLLAIGLKYYTIKNLYAVSFEKGVSVSITKCDINEIKAITYDLAEDSLIKESLKAIGYHSNEKLINYFMPADWYYSDLPMEVPADKKGHFTPDNWQKDKFKILITKVLPIKKEPLINAKYILLKTQRRIPVIVVIWDRCKKKIVGYENVPATVRWGDIPTPLF